MKEEKHRLKICPKCKKPVVGTFCMVYKEFGCIECNLWWKFFNDLEEIDNPSDEQWKEYQRRENEWSDDETYIGIRYGGMICGTNHIKVFDCKCQKCMKQKKIKPKFWKSAKHRKRSNKKSD